MKRKNKNENKNADYFNSNQRFCFEGNYLHQYLFSKTYHHQIVKSPNQISH